MPEPSDDGDEREEFSDLYGEDMDSDARVTAIINRVKTHVFDKTFPRPLVDMAKEKMGIKLDELELANRELKIVEFICGEGHIHRQIALIETFGKAANPETSDLSLNLAMDRMRAIAVTVPPTALGRYQEDQCKTVMGFGDDGTVKRAFSISQVFDTKARVVGYKAGLPPQLRATMDLQRARDNDPGLSLN